MVIPTFIDLNSDEHNQGLRHFQLNIFLHRCDRYCNTIDDPIRKICVPNKEEGGGLNTFNMITKINESKY